MPQSPYQTLSSRYLWTGRWSNLRPDEILTPDPIAPGEWAAD